MESSGGESPKLVFSSSTRSLGGNAEVQESSTIVVPEFASSAHIIPTITATKMCRGYSEDLEAIQSYVLFGKPFELKQTFFSNYMSQRPVVVIDPLVSGVSVPNDDKLAGTKLLVDHEAFLPASSSYEKVTAKINNETVVITFFPVKKESKKNVEVKPIDIVLAKFGTAPTAVALDAELGLFVGTRDGSLYRCALQSLDGEAVPGSTPVDAKEIQNIKTFNSSRCFLTKDKDNHIRLWSAKDTMSRLALNKAYYGHDYLYDTSIIRSHYSDASSGSWTIPSISLFGSSKDAVYELPMNYLMGTDLAKPAVMYAVLLQWLMLQKKASVESKALVAALPTAYARSVVEPAVIKAYEACVKEQAERLGHTFVPYNSFSIAKKSESTEK